MNRLTQFALIVAAGAVFVLLIERHATIPALAAERQRAQQFSGIVAECANGRDFQIDGARVKCRPAK